LSTFHNTDTEDNRYNCGTSRENKSKGGLEWLGTESRVCTLYWPQNNKTVEKVVLELYVFRVLLYGAQTWSLKQKDKKMLQIASRRWERRKPPAVWSDTVTNAEERQRNNPNDVEAAAYILKWKWGKPCGTN